MELFVVTAEGWREGYGSYVYLIGVFDSEKLAKHYCINEYYNITKVSLNTHNPLLKEKQEFEQYLNDNFLGGYIE